MPTLEAAVRCKCCCTQRLRISAQSDRGTPGIGSGERLGFGESLFAAPSEFQTPGCQTVGLHPAFSSPYMVAFVLDHVGRTQSSEHFGDGPLGDPKAFRDALLGRFRSCGEF